MVPQEHLSSAARSELRAAQSLTAARADSSREVFLNLTRQSTFWEETTWTLGQYQHNEFPFTVKKKKKKQAKLDRLFAISVSSFLVACTGGDVCVSLLVSFFIILNQLPDPTVTFMEAPGHSGAAGTWQEDAGTLCAVALLYSPMGGAVSAGWEMKANELKIGWGQD